MASGQRVTHGVTLHSPEGAGPWGGRAIAPGRRGLHSERSDRKIANAQIALRPRVFQTRRDGRVVDGGGLENHCTRKGTGGSNPSPSAKFSRRIVDLTAGAGESERRPVRET